MANLRDLYKCIGRLNIEMNLIAGSRGLDREIHWVHMVENLQISSFLSGGELIFITGVALKQETNLLRLIQGIWEHDAGGVVLNTGPYISQITAEVISFCETNAFPLFQVPWNVRMADIMRNCCIQILQSENDSAVRLEMALKQAIYFPLERDLYISCLEKHGLQGNETYCIVSCRTFSGSSSPDARGLYGKFTANIEDICFQRGVRAYSVMAEGALLFVFVGAEIAQIRMAMERLHAEMAEFTADETHMSVGSLEEGIECLHHSYQRARQVEKLQMKLSPPQRILFYDDMGIYKLLFEINNAAALKKFYRETLEPLVLYDRLNKTDYTELLELYLQHGGSIKGIAATLYVHRNTVNYKIKKIEEILQCNLSALEVRILYKLSYMVKNLI